LTLTPRASYLDLSTSKYCRKTNWFRALGELVEWDMKKFNQSGIWRSPKIAALLLINRSVSPQLLRRTAPQKSQGEASAEQPLKSRSGDLTLSITLNPRGVGQDNAVITASKKKSESTTTFSTYTAVPTIQSKNIMGATSAQGQCSPNTNLEPRFKEARP
jgi:hypothetical protein